MFDLQQAYGRFQLGETAGLLVCRDCITAGRNADNASMNIVPKARPVATPTAPAKRRLASKTTCPHCWHNFDPIDVLFVSQHPDLLGDPVAGENAQLRFRPSRFDSCGDALDLMDLPCQLLACPRCHLVIPRAILSTAPIYFSIIGVPACGKSHFLASLVWTLRRQMPNMFGIDFSDADPSANLLISQYEQTLFLAGDQDEPAALRKTELYGELYEEVTLYNHSVRLPKPFLFSMRSRPNGNAVASTRTLCLYDNAGEHFQPGMDTVSSPGTQHLAKSSVLFFLFDPTQHPRLREACRSVSQDPQLGNTFRSQRQEVALTEAAHRIRRYLKTPESQRHDKPLLVLINKSDIWSALIQADLESEPFIQPDSSSKSAETRSVVDIVRIERTSALLREFLLRYAPEFVTAAEQLSRQVVYLPCSALGTEPELEPSTGALGVCPRKISPRWVTIPLLYALAKWSTWIPGNGPALKRPTTNANAKSVASGALPKAIAGNGEHVA